MSFIVEIPSVFNKSTQIPNRLGNTTLTGNETIHGSLNVGGPLTLDGTNNITDKFTSNIPVIFNDTTNMLDVSGQNMDLSGSLDVIQNVTIGGNTTLTGALQANGGLSCDGTKFVVADATGNTSIGGTLGVTGTSSLSGNVGIGGDSGTETLLVTGSERVTSNLHVGGNLVVDGSFNFSEVIQNITTVNNEVILSTQLDISNQGTGPALKVSQFGVGDDQDVALFNAGDEGDAFKIDSSGNSHFYKEVDIVKENDVSFDTILIRRTVATAEIINLRTLQVYVNNVNILPSATNATQSIQSGSLGDVIEFMTWNDLVAQVSYGSLTYASNIRNNNVTDPYVVHSDNSEMAYLSLYIPLTQSFNISDIQSFVLYNAKNSYRYRINGFEIELYNRSNGFTPGTNVLYSMPINTSEYDYRFDLPAITSYTGGFASTDSETQIKDITVSASTQNFDTTLLKVEGGNTELGGNLSVSGTTTTGNVDISGTLDVTGDLSVGGVINYQNWSSGQNIQTKYYSSSMGSTISSVALKERLNTIFTTSFQPMSNNSFVSVFADAFWSVPGSNTDTIESSIVINNIVAINKNIRWPTVDVVTSVLFRSSPITLFPMFGVISNNTTEPFTIYIELNCNNTDDNVGLSNVNIQITETQQ